MGISGTSQGLNLTLNVEHEEYMSGLQAGTGAMVCAFRNVCTNNTLASL